MDAEVILLGLGNILLSDDGVGVHAIRFLEHDGSRLSNARFLDGGTLGFSLATELDSHQMLIVFDAVVFGGEAGDVCLFEGEAMDSFLGTKRRRTAHEISLLDLMAVAALSDRLPRRRALIGIEPQSFEWSTAPSPRVADALARACSKALRLIEKWQLP